MSRFTDAKASYEKAQLRLEDPVINERQKIPAGEEVYIRPIYERSMLHFTGDVITKVEGTYAQLYGGSNFSDYATNIASWYNEDQLMPTNGRSLEECRSGCSEYFDMPYDKIMEAKEDALNNCPFRKAVNEQFNKAFKEVLMGSFKGA